MYVYENLLTVVHVVGVVFMSVPLFNLIAVNERALFGSEMVWAVDRYLENLIRRSATRCYVFQLTVLVSGLLLMQTRLGWAALVEQWVLAAKTGLLVALMGLLSYVHFRLQPAIEALLGQVEGDPVPARVAAAIRPLRLQRKRLAAGCLFLVLTAVILGLQVEESYGPALTGVLVLAAALFAGRVYRSPVRFGWF